MVRKGTFKNWHVDAYLEGRLGEIPSEVLELAKSVAERRNVPDGPEPMIEDLPVPLDARAIVRNADGEEEA